MNKKASIRVISKKLYVIKYSQCYHLDIVFTFYFNVLLSYSTSNFGVGKKGTVTGTGTHQGTRVLISTVPVNIFKKFELTSSCPPAHAYMRGVLPLLNLAFTSAPWAISNLNKQDIR
jgi:hypothetical protein